MTVQIHSLCYEVKLKDFDLQVLAFIVVLSLLPFILVLNVYQEVYISFLIIRSSIFIKKMPSYNKLFILFVIDGKN